MSPSRVAVAAIVVSFTTMVSHAFGRATYAVLLPAIEDDLLSSHTQAGWGGTSIYGAYLIGVFVVASVAHRYEPISIMRVGLATGATGLAVVAVAPGAGVLFVGLALAGAAGAGIWITAPAIATAGAPPHRRGVIIGALSGAIGLALFTVSQGTNALRYALDDDSLWRPVFAIEAGLAVVILVAVVVFVRPGPTDAAAGGFSLTGLRTMPGWFNATAAYVCFAVMAGGFSQFLGPALEADGFSRSTVTTLFSSMGLAGVASAPLAGALSDRIGRRPTMLAVVIVLSAGAALVALGSGAFVVVGVVAFGAVMSTFPILTAAYVRDHRDARAFGAAFGAMTVFYGLSAVVTPVAMGTIADRAGFTPVYLALAAVGGVAVALVYGLPRSVPARPTGSELTPATVAGGD